MTHGGQRKNGGRKPGALNKRTRAIAEKAAAEGLTPLEIMVQIMREQWTRYTGSKKDPEAGLAAITAAKDLLPYMHARIAQTDSPIKIDGLVGTPTEQAKRVLQALGSGEVTPGQANTIMQAISSQMRILEVDELESRIKSLEERASTE